MNLSEYFTEKIAARDGINKKSITATYIEDQRRKRSYDMVLHDDRHHLRYMSETEYRIEKDIADNFLFSIGLM